MAGTFSFVPFLGYIESVSDVTDKNENLLKAVARVAPILIPASLFDQIKHLIPTNADYYILLDNQHQENDDDPIKYLDNGALKIVTNNVQLISQVAPDRLVLQINQSTATLLADPVVLAGISGVLLETSSFAFNLLKSYRSALNLAPPPGTRPKDLFILSSLRDEDPNSVLQQPASLKLMSKTVQGTSVIPAKLLSLDIGNHTSPQATDDGRLSVTTLFTSALRSDREDGLFPTIPVSLSSVPSTLGLVYSSAASIANTIISGNAVYYSRSRNGLWRKGETSGAMQMVDRIRVDCDADALEFGVIETGPNGDRDGFCHVPDQTSCFGSPSGLVELEATLKSRFKDAPKGSYTARLFSEPKLLQAKIMEEAAELCEAKSKEDVAAEMADLIYFALAKCVASGVGLREVGKVLDQRSLKVTRRKGDAKGVWKDKLGLDASQAKGVDGGPPASSSAQAVTAPVPAPVVEEKKKDDTIRCQTFDLATVSPTERSTLLKRPIQSSSDISALVTPIINTVKTQGDAGLRSLVHKFDRCVPAADPSFPLVLQAPFSPELMVLDPAVKAAIDQAYHNIRVFHQAQMDREKTPLLVETMPGVVCSRFARPIERVGVYVPGGTAILPSTALMLAVPAQVVKSSLITLATPPRPDGTISPEIVYIASITGVNSIVRAGGAQAVAALAYGTETVPKVDKIFGPGNQFVTAAKMAVSMDSGSGTAIDMPAGPSEVLVIADKTCRPSFVASDLLAQAEHGVDSQVVLLTVGLDSPTIDLIEKEINSQALALPRVDIIRESIAKSLIVKCKDIGEAMDFSNSYAPEHLILHTENAAGLLDKVQNAGSVFVGPYSPESCGDYASGTNHTLPTYGYARQYSGVSTLSFLKHITSQELTLPGLRVLGPVVETLARAEGLDGHKMAVTVRLTELGRQ
ncbi:hypothetical protein T439DRAFT_313600 [Meredithblackwellia eburnea MCA 4105]